MENDGLHLNTGIKRVSWDEIMGDKRKRRKKPRKCPCGTKLNSYSKTRYCSACRNPKGGSAVERFRSIA